MTRRAEPRKSRPRTRTRSTGGARSPSKSTVFRPGGISYLDVPSRDPRGSAEFYRTVFGWNVEERPGTWSFEDGTGHVIGHFLSDRAVSGDSGVLPYVYVENLDRVLEKVVAAKGSVVRPPFPVGDLWVATIQDPSSNIIGIWQRGAR